MKTIMTLALLVAFAAPALAQSIEFQREVAQKRTITLGEAAMIFYGLVNAPKADLTPEAAYTDLVSKGIMPEGWKDDLGGDASLGQVSVLICKTLDISGGAMMNLTGSFRRYSYRECARLRLVKPAGPHSSVPGRDLIAIAGRVEDHLEQKKK